MFSQIHLDITPDMVLQGQGADPKAIAKRKPFLIETAKNAILEGRQLVRPNVIYRALEIDRISHHTIHLEDGYKIENKVLTQELFSASKIYFIICTIGEDLEKKISSLFSVDPVFSLALDGYGNAALETLVSEACNIIGITAQEKGMNLSIPFSPGIEGWPVQAGQELVFSILNPDPNYVRLTSSFQMIPKKTSSLIIGIGKNFNKDKNPCDFCPSKNICRYHTEKEK